MLRSLFVLCVLGFGCGIANGEIRAGGENPSQALLSPEKEMELALNAGPAHLRNEATVYIFGKLGYEKFRAGTNGFNCMVNRDGTQTGDYTLHPTCWDPEGSRTILPVMLRVGELIARNKSAAEIKRDIDDGFDQGRFHSPGKSGIAYMLTGDVKFDPKTGDLAATVFPPHYMIYAPGVTNADIGRSKEATTPGLPFVYSGYSGGEKTAYIIVMASDSAAHTMR
jgi:hypothetical protein